MATVGPLSRPWWVSWWVATVLAAVFYFPVLRLDLQLHQGALCHMFTACQGATFQALSYGIMYLFIIYVLFQIFSA